jgi:hypothetical protein
MKLLRTLKVVVATAVLGLAANASATPVLFDLAGAPGSSVGITSFAGDGLCNLTGCGASVALNSNLDSLHATLDAGDSWSFDLFSISLHGLGGGTGTLAATLAFDAPTGAPNASGSGSGSFVTGFFLSGGDLLWTSQPGLFVLVDGTSYSVTFQNLLGVTFGNDVTVRANLRLWNGPSVGVPEPGSLGLFGFGLLAVAFAMRRGRVRDTA